MSKAITPDTQIQQKMIERLNNFPVEIRRRTYAMKGLSKQLEALRNSHNVDVTELEMNYQNSLKHLYEERSLVIDKETDPAQGIPSFWLNCLLHNDITSPMISSRDKKALESLRNISVEYLENDIGKGFILNFHFDSSNFFDKQVLRKAYHQEFVRGEPILIKTEGFEIQWKSPEVDLTRSVRKQSTKRKSRSGEPEISPSDSFFNFFNPPRIPESDDEEDVDYENLEIEIEMDYELGMAIKNQIVPFAVDYFVGERH